VRRCLGVSGGARGRPFRGPTRQAHSCGPDEPDACDFVVPASCPARGCLKARGEAESARACAEAADRSRAQGLLPLVLLLMFLQPGQSSSGAGPEARASAGRGRHLVAARSVARVVRAAAPPGSKGQSEEFGPRRALGSVDIDGRGVQHELGSFGPFVFLEDALLPRGKMPPFNRHPHAGLLSLTLLLRGDCVKVILLCKVTIESQCPSKIYCRKSAPYYIYYTKSP
jgi:hypothetical protein